MKISSKGDSSIRTMIDIIVFGSADEPVQSKDIASRQGISQKFVEQVLHTLKKANVIRSVRGALGGYALNVDPDEYTIADLLKITDKEFFSVRCDVQVCPRDQSLCPVHDIVDKTNRLLYEELSVQTFSEIAAEFKKRNNIT